jgi:hypothetical protein
MALCDYCGNYQQHLFLRKWIRHFNVYSKRAPTCILPGAAASRIKSKLAREISRSE